jgi:hypothetical protein
MLKVTRTLLAVSAFIAAAGGGPLRAQRRPITAEEIERASAVIATAYDAVDKLRPRWLQAPREVLQLPGSSPDAQLRMARIHVYQDDHDMGGVDFLRSIPAERVATIRWLSTSEAGSRFGPSEGPAIVVTLIPAGPARR